MSVNDFLQLSTQIIFFLLFLVVLLRVIRHPRREAIDTLLLFGAPAIDIAITWLTPTLRLAPGSPAIVVLAPAVLIAIPYLLLRLVDDFAVVPVAALRVAEAGLAASVAGFVVFGASVPVWATTLMVLYFVGYVLYTIIAFKEEAQRTTGVTRRRMQAVAIGSGFLGLSVLVAGIQAALPAFAADLTVLGSVLNLGSGIGYFLGFAPPAPIRRAWQEPGLRSFLASAPSVAEVADLDEIVADLERGAADTLGAQLAVIARWDENTQVLRFTHGGRLTLVAPGQGIIGRVFSTQRATFSTDLARESTEIAEIFRPLGVTAALAAPITLGSDRIGVLALFAKRGSFFVEDDLALVQLLAQQSAVILRNRALIDETARLEAQRQALNLKEDFISAAAHELKTPLTVMLGQAQLLERQALRHPEAPPDLAGIRRIVESSRQLDALVRELLEASRVEPGQSVDERRPVDLTALARESCDELTTELHPCALSAPGPVIGEFVPARIQWLLDNLIVNAIEYSPQGGDVDVRIWQDGDEAHLTVTDHGIGIPTADLAHVFERFYRGHNVDVRRFPGMGIGLFIAREIAQQHGGQIWATSPGPGQGSTFHVTLPLRRPSSA